MASPTSGIPSPTSSIPSPASAISSPAQGSASFQWPDYLVFSVSILLSVGIGIFFTIKDRKNQTNEEFLMAGRSMSIVPVTASTFATIVSSIGLVAFPVEVYNFGFGYFIFVIGSCLCVFPVAEIFMPVFHPLKLTSAFQYLEVTFNPTVRRVASSIQAILMFLMMGMMTYAPSVSLAQVSGINVWTSIILTTAVCTFYTTFGGMKAVVYADTAQMFLILAGVLLLAFKAIADLGGWGPAMAIIWEGGRINQFNWNPDPFMRSGFWAYLIGGFAHSCIAMSSSQLAIQRYCTLPTLRQAKISAYLIAPAYLLLGSVILLVGLAMYGHFADCDPGASGQVLKDDQYISLLALKVLAGWPGLPGLYIACIFAASLSTLSSGQNAMAAMVLSDMVEPWYRHKYDRNMSEKTALFTAKGIAFVVGLLVMCSSFATVALGQDLFTLLAKAGGIFAGPLAGMFSLGIFFKSVRDATAVLCSFCLSTAVCLWIGIGAQIYNFDPHKLPVSTDGCFMPSNNTRTSYENTSASFSWRDVTTPSNQEFDELIGLARIYNLSPLYYGLLGYTLMLLFSFMLDSICKCSRKCKAKGRAPDVKYIQVDTTEGWTKEVPMSLSTSHNDTSTKADSSAQTDHTIPPLAQHDVLVVRSIVTSL